MPDKDEIKDEHISQQESGVLPTWLQLDKAFEKMDADESPFLKNLGIEITSNPNLNLGMDPPSQEGQNWLVMTPIRSNTPVPNLPALPVGYNKNIGGMESTLTHEYYYFTFNSNGNHCIHVLNADTGIVSKVIEDSNLQFTDTQANFFTEHRCMLRIVQDQNGNTTFKFLLLTDGNTWHKWVEVISAIATNGYNQSQFPYYTLQQPHFDRRELLEWAVRPCMVNPVAVPVANTPAVANNPNYVQDIGFQFAVINNNTDGRWSVLGSAWSLPVWIKSEDYDNSPDNLPKSYNLTLYAGSPLTESVDLYVRRTAPGQTPGAVQISWGPWLKYIRLYRFTSAGSNSPTVIGNNFWQRTGSWSQYNYNAIFNTIQFNFDNSLIAESPVVDTTLVQTGMPQASKALVGVGDAALLVDNLSGYNNLPQQQTNQLSVTVQQQPPSTCPQPLRHVRLYAYCGRPGDSNGWQSQVGYYDGTDTQMRFGGTVTGPTVIAEFSKDESVNLGLNFADHSAFVCYFKGTPYYSVGTWYQVNNDTTGTNGGSSYVALTSLLDFSNNDVLEYVQSIFTQGGYFMCVFDLYVPPGHYDAAIARHSTNLTADYRDVSTYVYGLADSKRRTMGSQGTAFVQPNALVDGPAGSAYSKEWSVDCTSGNYDPWGTGQDLFYIYCPYLPNVGLKEFRFIEGYLQESENNPIGVEQFPYVLNNGANDWGRFTDKNGFYWAYTTRTPGANTQSIFIGPCKLNCQLNIVFNIPTSRLGFGWIVDGNAYISDHNQGVFGNCNRILVTGTILALDGVTPLANVGVSMFGGATTYTGSDGTFTLVVHNGQEFLLNSAIYVNAGGNFYITTANCGIVQTFPFSESRVPCFNCNTRNYPDLINLLLNAQSLTQTSVKENGTYSVGLVVADLAGRMGFVNVFQNVKIPSFLVNGNTYSQYLQMLIGGSLGLPSQFAWAAPCVSNNLGILKFIQWVGDSLNYVDAAGNVVTDPASAVFVSIAINSFYNYNVAKNFTLLTGYQFALGDRIRILDDGIGDLLTVAKYGQPIDLQILGTNYNQAVETAGILPNSSNVPIINQNTTFQQNTTINNPGGATTSSTTPLTLANEINITLYVKYTPKFAELIANTGVGNNGFWIELYTPFQQAQSQSVPYNILPWYPVINGEIAIFNGFVNGKPTYIFPTSINLPFWDTYLFSRNINIPNVGSRNFTHPFESQNISDNFGYQVSSGGPQTIKNDNAKQLWFPSKVSQSEDLTSIGILNGLGFFAGGSKEKDFSQYPWGSILCAHAEMNYLFFLCENDWFTTDFNFHYAYPNAQGVMITNLDQGLSTPHQKLGQKYGCSFEDTGTIVIADGQIGWYDRKNETYIISDYREAVDICKGQVESYFNVKTNFITEWNNTAAYGHTFDVIAGIDLERLYIHITFRPRRSNSNAPASYVNQLRNTSLDHQETFVYSLKYKKWVRTVGFAPESYGKVRGNAIGTQMITFAAGIPYLHNSEVLNFNNFYGIQTESVMAGVDSSESTINKVWESISLDINGMAFYFASMYTNEPNSFSYISMKQITDKENLYYASVKKDMNSYPEPTPNQSPQWFRSMQLDGKRVYSLFLVYTLVQDPMNLGNYFEIKKIYTLYRSSARTKK